MTSNIFQTCLKWHFHRYLKLRFLQNIFWTKNPEKLPLLPTFTYYYLSHFFLWPLSSPTFLENGDVIYGRPHRSEDSISTKSSHHTNVMLRKHSEGRHSERSRQEHSSNRKRSVRLNLNYLEMHTLTFWQNYTSGT